MSLVALPPLNPHALADALTQRGYPAAQLEATVRGLRPVALVLDEIGAAERDALLAVANRVGIDCATGDDWVLLSGGVSALGALTRPEGSPLPERLLQLIAAALAPPADRWTTARGAIDLSRPQVVGILNVTPDSFSDGGRFLEPDAALAQAQALVADGADMLDVGAESTRPGRPEPVSVDEEWHRLAPVLEGIAQRFPDIPFMVDTVKAETARRAIEAGAWAINDVSGLRIDPAVADECAAGGVGLVLMHSRGTVTDMATYDHARYGHVTAAVVRELRDSMQVALDRGVPAERVVLDPGLGFAKTPEQSLAALRDVAAVTALGRPVMVGPSRKRFLGTATGRDVGERDVATAAACVMAYTGGATLFRVHAVGPTRDALAVAHAVGAG